MLTKKIPASAGLMSSAGEERRRPVNRSALWIATIAAMRPPYKKMNKEKQCRELTIECPIRNIGTEGYLAFISSI